MTYRACCSLTQSALQARQLPCTGCGLQAGISGNGENGPLRESATRESGSAIQVRCPSRVHDMPELTTKINAVTAMSSIANLPRLASLETRMQGFTS